MTVGNIWMFITSIRFSNYSNSKFATRHHQQIINQKLEAVLPFHFPSFSKWESEYKHLFIFEWEILFALDNCGQWHACK